MSKSVAKNDVITLGGHNISDWVSRWALIAVAGDLHLAEVDIITDHPDTPLKISINQTTKDVGPRGMTGYKEIVDTVTSATITINGTDISDHVGGWREIVDVGQPKKVRLKLHADPDLLTIESPIL